MQGGFARLINQIKLVELFTNEWIDYSLLVKMTYETDESEFIRMVTLIIINTIIIFLNW